MCLGTNGVLCTDQTGDTIEQCNAMDDDCDDDVDEGMGPCGGVCPLEVTLGTSCDGPDADECQEGAWVCNAEHSATCSDDSGDTPETCNDSDDDCDGITDEGCPDAPALVSPLNGDTTGSVWATSETLQVKPRRPTFRWKPSAEAAGYELEIDDSCERPYSSCPFESPEVAVSVTTTSYTLTADLPVSTAPPVGRRYFWRVRACGVSGCSPYSRVRYVDVARQKGDVNGDGYSDLLIGASTAEPEGAAYLYFGRADAPTTQWDVRILGEGGSFGGTVALPGDVDGDGFGEVLIGARGWDLNDTINVGRAYIIFGARTDQFDPSNRVEFEGVNAQDNFGIFLASLGDLEGDGYCDIAVGTHYISVAELSFIHGGERSEIDSQVPWKLGRESGELALNYFGRSTVSVGDLDDDGYSDIFVGARGVGGGAGRGYVFLGPDSGFAHPAHAILDGEAGEGFGWTAVPVGDVTGDGIPDLIIGTAGGNDVLEEISLYEGTPTGSLTKSQTETVTSTGLEDGFAIHVTSAGDVNADGFVDVLANASSWDVTPDSNDNTGRAFLFFGGPQGLSTGPVRTFVGSAVGDHFSASLNTIGDINGDGFSDFAISGLSNSDYAGSACVYLGHVDPLAIMGTCSFVGNAGDQFGTLKSF